MSNRQNHIQVIDLRFFPSELLSEKPTKVSSNINGLQSFFFIYPRENFPEEKLKKLMLRSEVLPDSFRKNKSRSIANPIMKHMLHFIICLPQMMHNSLLLFDIFSSRLCPVKYRIALPFDRINIIPIIK